MRKCKGKYWESGMGWVEFELGYFHQWGCNYEEFENGAGNFSTAIVELPDGRIIMPMANDIQFLKESEETPTAYDIDTICKNLDKASDYYETNEQGKEHVRMVNLEEAIEIVRNGGKKE